VRGVSFVARFVATVVVGALFAAVCLVAIAPRVRDLVSANVSQRASFDLSGLAATSFVYAADGSILGELKGEVDRKEVRLTEVSPRLVRAVLAVEDDDFYEHDGINVRSIGRALVENVSAGGVRQGGSTITQQLVKNAVLDDVTRDLDRKIPEAVLATRLEEQMTKDEILERYLNTVYFGGGAYGVEAAALTFFNKPAKDLAWPEAALLASLINNPNRNDPTINPERAIEQRSIALRRLVETGDITEAERTEYELTKLPDRRFELKPASERFEPNYFLEEVKQNLLRLPQLGETAKERQEAIFAGGLRIRTTLDPTAQQQAEAAVRDNLPDDPREFTAALASIEPSTGAVRAMVGGPGFDRLKYNIATTRGRQTGSAFKPFVLAAAIEQGVVPDDWIDGTGPCVFDNAGSVEPVYVANNFNNDPGRVGDVFGLTLSSSNCGYLRLGQVAGMPNVIDTSRVLGITAPLQNVLSLPLGVIDVTPLDMAAAYAAIANDGKRNSPYYIDLIEDRAGNVLYEHEAAPTRAVSTQTARLVTSVLEGNVRSGTGTRARLGPQPAAGKTGTTQDYTDAWFVGYTPYLATAVWMGNTEGRVEMRSVGSFGTVTGGSYPAIIWGQFNRAFHEGKPVREFTAAERTRAGRDLRTPSQRQREDPCFDQPLLYDLDGDGQPDSCVPPAPVTTSPGGATGVTTTTRAGGGSPATSAPPTTAPAPTTARAPAAPAVTRAAGEADGARPSDTSPSRSN
jgi:membrane peptidoglycan carboxypeptidase